ncbi:hypothetical protein DFH08DRAFT_705296, partial [Mycena albidolilacea]
INCTESPLCPCCQREDKMVLYYLAHCPDYANACAKMYCLDSHSSCDIEKLLSKPKLLPLLFQFVAQSGQLHTVFGELPSLNEDMLEDH